MSDRWSHEAAAASNAATAVTLTQLGGDPQNWVPTIWFYVGVQLVEAALADHGEHCKEHGDRFALLVKPLGVQRTSPYRELQILSSRWRYLGIAPDARDVERAQRWAKELCVELKERWPSTAGA